ncbi:protein rep, partial [Xanthomonas hortorum pv. hederae]
MGEGLKRLARYGNAKSHTLRLLDTTGDTAAKQAGLRVADIRRCGDWLLFRHFPTTKQTKLRAANFCCTHLICGFCAIRRGARMMARYLDRFTQARGKRPELQPFLVTLTVRNGEDLRERLDHLDRALTRLNKRRHGKRSRSIMTSIQGAVWSYEVTFSSDKGWHPHVHAVWLALDEPDQFALRREWEEITGDSFMCDVRPIQAVRRQPDD